MAYTDDWENLMNGVFGAGGRPRFGGTAQPESKTPKAKAPAMPDLNAALLENQKQLDCLLYTSPSPRDRSLSRMPSSA